MHRLKRGTNAALILSATASLFALPAVLGPAGAQEGGLSACDHSPTFRDVSCQEVDRAVTEASREFRVSEVRMREIVRCESQFDPFASNGPYQGLFQQSTSYWSGRVGDFNAAVDPDVPGDVHHPFDNARVSARMLATNGDSDWPNC